MPRLPGTESSWAVAVIILTWLLTTAIWLTPGITIPDGAGYYVYLPSTWLDRDLLFFDEWQQFGLIPRGQILFKEITPTNHLGNHWTVGSALFWYPAFVAGDAARHALGFLQRFPRNGISLPYNVAVVMASAVAGLATLLMGWRVARSVSETWAATLATIGVWLGSPLMWYSIRNSLVAHVISSMACALVVLLSLRLRSSQRPSDFLAVGLAAGFAFIVRPQNAPFVLFPLIVVPLSIWRSPARRLVKYGFGFLIGILPQLVISTVLYGNPLRFLAGEPRGGWIFFERIWSWEPVFSWFHGLLPWSPFVALSIAGWLVLLRRDWRLAIGAIFAFLTQWLINATLDRSFWGGFAFGQRRFDNCAILFLIGAAALLDRLPRTVAVILTVVTSAWTLSLFLAATSVLDLNLYYAPGELLSAQIQAARNARLEFLQFVPEGMRSAVAAVALIALLVMGTIGALVLLVRRKAAGVIPAVTVTYFLVMSGFLAFCGVNGSRHAGEYVQLIAYNRSPAILERLADWRIELLRQELRYLEKAGRDGAAMRTRAELEAALSRRKL